MKKFTLIIAVILIFFGKVSAQSGLTGINYQAVARNNDGTVLAKQNVKVRISILGTSASGPVQYQESHDLTTNTLGLLPYKSAKVRLLQERWQAFHGKMQTNIYESNWLLAVELLQI